MKANMNYEVIFRTPNHDNTALQTIAAFDAPDYRTAACAARYESVKLPFIYNGSKIYEVAILGFVGRGETYQRQFVEFYEDGKKLGRLAINNESKF